MGIVRVGTVGYSYRDWAGILYPPGTPSSRQLSVYARNFDVCEITSFTNQMPDLERVSAFVEQIKGDLRLYVRLHHTFTHCADVGLALTVAKHFRKAIEPMFEQGKLAGLVGAFPYAFKNSAQSRGYLEALASALHFDASCPLQVDFRHSSWISPEAHRWLADRGLGLVLVDEPALPGLVPPLATATASRVLVRLHGRNAEGWWSGNPTTRFDYFYSQAELCELKERYERLLGSHAEVSFVFQNSWQGQSIENARQFRALLVPRIAPLVVPGDAPMQSQSLSQSIAPLSEDGYDDPSRPPTSLPLSEVKSRVSRALSSFQESFDLPPREP